MKSHEKKMHEKAEHEAELERNDLNAWFQKTWSRMKSGDIISRKFALYAIAIGAIVGLAIYLLNQRTGDAGAWKNLDNANTIDSLDDFAKTNSESLPAKVARLQKARQLLGPRGLTLLTNAIDPNVRRNSIRSIEEAREILTKLIEEFKGDLTLQCQAIEAAAQAELALVGIPKEGTSDASKDFRGSVEKAIELFRRYEKIAGPVAGESAKNMADELEKKKSDVVRLSEFINEKLSPSRPQPKIEVPPSLTPTPAGPTPAPK